MGVVFRGSCLKQDKNTYDDGKVVKIYIVYEIRKNISSRPRLENCLSCAVTLTKNVDIDNYKCSEYGIGFASMTFFSHNSDGTATNVIILEYMWVHLPRLTIGKKDILILSKGPTKGLENTLSAAKMYSINFTGKFMFELAL